MASTPRLRRLGGAIAVLIGETGAGIAGARRGVATAWRALAAWPIPRPAARVADRRAPTRMADR